MSAPLPSDFAKRPEWRDSLTGRDAAVWAATYGAEFVRKHWDARTHGCSYAECVSMATETALTLADEAVAAMRPWEAENEL